MSQTLKNSGFSMVEMMVVIALFSVVTLAGSMLFISAVRAWDVTDAKISLQENSRQISQRVLGELQESGVGQGQILDNLGVNATDIVRFAVPLCLCGQSPLNDDGEVRTWGAPLVWGRTGCGSDYPQDINGNVQICHVDNGNINQAQTQTVAFRSVNAHLAHGDWIGACGACNPAVYNNRTIEYSLDAQGRIVRRVLDAANNIVNSAVIARNVANFQANFQANGNVGTVTLNYLVTERAGQNLEQTVNEAKEVLLRNGN